MPSWYHPKWFEKYVWTVIFGVVVGVGCALPVACWSDDAYPLESNLVSLHDQGRGVTCWVHRHRDGISCLPDTVLTYREQP
jgi:hypothetical protein